MSQHPNQTIDVCICTYRREHIVDTLHSLAMLELPFGYSTRIIVADNDTTPSAQVMVATAAENDNLTITYLHAPESNISIARNACLNAATADYLAFIDDDQIVDPHWLANLLRRMQTTAADAVLGPVQAVYPAECPEWLLRGDYHSNKPVWVKGKIITGYTCNVLLQRTAKPFQNLRFNEAFGTTGGEDSDFFTRAHLAGAHIDYTPDAIIYEPVPPYRANLRWLLRRRYRYGETHALALLTRGWRPYLFCLAVAKIIVCCLAILLSLFKPSVARYWLLRATLHLGVARTLLRTARKPTP